MGEWWVYDWKKGLLTAGILSIGSMIIFSINSGRNPNWDMFLSVIVPSLFFVSFVPIGFSRLINKFKGIKE